MRISHEIAIFFRDIVKMLYPEAKVYLFGSRVIDDLKGGDIDILAILALTSTKLSISQIAQVKIEFYNRFGEQRLDFVNFTFDEKNIFKDIIYNLP